MKMRIAVQWRNIKTNQQKNYMLNILTSWATFSVLRWHSVMKLINKHFKFALLTADRDAAGCYEHVVNIILEMFHLRADICQGSITYGSSHGNHSGDICCHSDMNLKKPNLLSNCDCDSAEVNVRDRSSRRFGDVRSLMTCVGFVGYFSQIKEYKKIKDIGRCTS